MKERNMIEFTGVVRSGRPHLTVRGLYLVSEWAAKAFNWMLQYATVADLCCHQVTRSVSKSFKKIGGSHFRPCPLLTAWEWTNCVLLNYDHIFGFESLKQNAVKIFFFFFKELNDVTRFSFFNFYAVGFYLDFFFVFFFFFFCVFIFGKENGFRDVFPCVHVVCFLFFSGRKELERYKERQKRMLFSHLVSHGYVNLYFGTDARTRMDRVRKKNLARTIRVCFHWAERFSCI